MKIAYLDCFSGASGDMILGALVDAGVPLADLRADVARLGIEGLDLGAERVMRRGVEATKIHVIVPAGDKAHRHLHHIEKLIDAAALDAEVKDTAVAIFRNLARAEGKIHGIAPEKVHFHEVGAFDAIADVVGAAAGFRRLGASEIRASALPLGSGFVDCQHGRFPVPGPATAELLRGVPVVMGEGEGELVTPTGAAILTTVCRSFGEAGAFTIDRIGYGAGTRERKDVPNVLRLVTGTAAAPGAADSVAVLECEIDDQSGETLAPLLERLLATGAVDAYFTPVVMKKGRPGTLVTALVPEAARDAVERALFRETTTFGIRRTTAERRKLDRKHVEVETPFGRARMKVGLLDGAEVTRSPEFEDCQKLAAEKGVPVRDVFDAVRAAYAAARAVR